MSNPVTKFALFELAILIPLAAGFFWRMREAVNTETPRRIFWLSLICFETPIYMFLGWGLSLRSDLLFLPLIGFLSALGGLATLIWFGRRFGYDRASLGTLAASGALSNQGYFLGGYLCLLLIGEEGLALSVVYIFYWNFLVYGLLFPISRWASGESERLDIHPVTALRQLFTDLRALPLPGFLFGLILNQFDVVRPDWISAYLKYAPPVSSILILFGVGITIDSSQLRLHSRLVPAVALTKFAVMPAIALGAAWMVGLDHHAFAVVAIESTCPTAIFSVVISTLFAMNTRLASTLFVWSTGIFMMVICPLLMYLFSGPFKP